MTDPESPWWVNGKTFIYSVDLNLQPDVSSELYKSGYVNRPLLSTIECRDRIDDFTIRRIYKEYGTLLELIEDEV